jgi:hypothetical protein
MVQLHESMLCGNLFHHEAHSGRHHAGGLCAKSASDCIWCARPGINNHGLNIAWHRIVQGGSVFRSMRHLAFWPDANHRHLHLGHRVYGLASYTPWHRAIMTDRVAFLLEWPTTIQIEHLNTHGHERSVFSGACSINFSSTVHFNSASSRKPRSR